MSPVNRMRFIEIECPNCHDRYRIHELELQDGFVPCWKCGATYIQKLHNTNNFWWARQALFKCKGH